MTTFTLQDLNDYKVTQEEEEAFKQMENIGLKELFTDMGQDLTAQHAPQPQATLTDIVNNICTQLQLLATVISQPQGNSQPSQAPSGENSLQQCVALTLQQADWFKEMVGACVDEEMVREAVKDSVECEVEHYFDTRFDPSEHFDFGDAVADRVDEMLDDVVRERVMDSLEEVVAEKLSEASVSISF